MKIASGKMITGLSIVTESLISQSVHMSLITQATQVFCVKQLFRESLCNYVETTPKGIVGSFQAYTGTDMSHNVRKVLENCFT